MNELINYSRFFVRHPSEEISSVAPTPLFRVDIINQKHFGDNTFKNIWNAKPRYRFTQSHLKFLGTLANIRAQPGWIFPTPAKVLVNIMQTEDMDTWSGQVEGSEECGMFLCALLFFRCSFRTANNRSFPVNSVELV